MGTFKGTKGKWEIKNNTSNLEVHSDMFGKKVFISHVFLYKERKNLLPHENISVSKESEANALLISKAPEMLEMLEKLVEIEEYLGGSDIEKEIKKLIKEATEI